LPDSVGRRRAVPAAFLAAALFISLAPGVASSATAPAGLEPFLYALGQVESGGSYTAYNSSSGAYGKYQIIPSSWAAWALAYLGSSTAPKTPTNQEIVAHHKVTALYNWLDSWPVVAHWWLTGSSERNSALWSSSSRSYVDKVMTIMKAASGVGTTSSSTTSWISSDDARFSDTAIAITYRSSWSLAYYASYSRGHAKYSSTLGATASFTFTGKGIAWVGPKGPTRGSARVSIDGVYVATVKLYSSTFVARSVVFARPLASGSHTVVIRLVTSGKPVAIDELIVGA
jgi:Transglycosylase-like domain